MLLLAIFGQLTLLAWQIRTRQEASGVRVWAVTAVTPLARVAEEVRTNVVSFFRNYTMLSDAQRQNISLKRQVDALKLENGRLKGELEFADRVKAIAAFQQYSPFKYLGARITSNTPGTTAKVVYVDRGSASGVMKGMPVVTPDGMVGKVVASYPTAALLMMINDPTFAVGVISQKNRVRGVAKGRGTALLTVEYIHNDQKVEPGELFFTSGEDRSFPKGIQVGKTVVSKPGRAFREVQIEPAFDSGLEEVLIVVSGGHQPIPEPKAPPAPEMQLLETPPGQDTGDAKKFEAETSKLETDADKIQQHYKRVEQWNGGRLGTSGRIPNFNVAPPPVKTEGGAETPAGPAAPAPPLTRRDS